MAANGDLLRRPPGVNWLADRPGNVTVASPTQKSADGVAPWSSVVNATTWRPSAERVYIFKAVFGWP